MDIFIFHPPCYCDLTTKIAKNCKIQQFINLQHLHLSICLFDVFWIFFCMNILILPCYIEFYLHMYLLFCTHVWFFTLWFSNLLCFLIEKLKFIVHIGFKLFLLFFYLKLIWMNLVSSIINIYWLKLELIPNFQF